MNRLAPVVSTLAAAVALAATPPPSPTPAVAPMPTDAQCVPLGRPMSKLPFSPGEVLDFDIDALGARAARMTMRTEPLRDGAYPVEVSVETNTFFSKMRRVRGTGTSHLDARTLRSKRYHEDATEDTVHRVADVSFKKGQPAHLTSSINGRSGTRDLRHGDDVTDVVGAIALLRALPLKEGMPVCFDVYAIRAIWRVWGTVAPKEHVSLPVGEFEAFHLEGEAARLDIPNARRQVHVWISDDARRLPLAAIGMIDLGAVRATLTAISRPRETSTRAENKGNLKW